MGKPFTIQEDDEQRIEELKAKTGAKTKIDVLRMALALLEQEIERQTRVAQWRKAVGLVGDSSREATAAFRKHSRLKRTVP